MSEELEKLQAAIVAKTKDELIEKIVSKTQKERVSLSQSYQQKYGKELETVLNKELSSDFKDLCIYLFKDQIDYDCFSLYKAMKGAGTNEDTLIDVIATRKGNTLKSITQRFPELYKEDLAGWVKDETSGTFQKLLLSLLKGERIKNDNPDKQECDEYAKKFDDLVNKKTKDETILDDIFVKRSPKELAFISRAYHRLTGQTILKGIEKYASSDLKNLLTTIIYANISPSEYWATQVNKSIKGAGTNEALLDRVIVTRCDTDIEKVGKYYEKLYGVKMSEDIIDDTSGDYQKLLLKLCKF